MNFNGCVQTLDNFHVLWTDDRHPYAFARFWGCSIFYFYGMFRCYYVSSFSLSFEIKPFWCLGETAGAFFLWPELRAKIQGGHFGKPFIK